MAGTTATIMSGVGIAAQAMGTLAGGRAAAASGRFQQQVSQINAANLESQALAREQQAGQERAVGQRGEFDIRRQGDLLASTAQSRVAASGADLSSPSVITAIGDLNRDTEVRALNALFESEERARGLEFGAEIDRQQAIGERFTGDVAADLGRRQRGRARLSALGTLASGGASLFDKYTGLRGAFGG